MKRDHIKIIFLLLFLQLQLLASTYEWRAEVNKKSAFINEAIYLKYSCEFSDRGELYVIDFNPMAENESVTIRLLSETTKIVNSKRINSYEFVAFVHKFGEMIFEFDTVMKKTNQDSIENTVFGRDNEEYEEFTKRFMKQEALHVEVKSTTDKIVGKLNIDIKSSEKKIKAYEPYQIEIILEGVANFHDIEPLKFNLEGVKVFSSKPNENIKLTKDGYVGSWRQKVAFVSGEDFEIPEFNFSYFDLAKASKVEHTFKKSKVSVAKGYIKEELLDEDESFSFNYDYLYYLLSFIAGFLISKVKIKPQKKMNSKEKIFREKIESLSSLDDVIFTLVLEDAKKYRDIVKKIETKELTSLKEVKRLITDSIVFN